MSLPYAQSNNSANPIGYRLYTVVPRLLQVIDNLTNWYIRFNRKRLKGAAGLDAEDTKAALDTLCQVLFTLVRALAPFTPFITEHIYRLLQPYLGDTLSEFANAKSVHFLAFPTVQESLFDEVIQRKVSAMQKVIQLARVARERKTIPLKTPLLTLVVIADAQQLSDIEELQNYVKEELNIRDIVLTNDEERYGIHLEARVDWPILGKKLKRDAQVVRKALPDLTQEQLRQYLKDKKITIKGIELEGSDLTIVRVIAKDNSNMVKEEGVQYEPAFLEDMIILLDTAAHPELIDDGIARDVMTRVQKMRKTAGLVPTDDVRMQYSVVSNPEGVQFDTLVSTRQSQFENTVRGPLEPFSPSGGLAESIILEEEHILSSLTLLLRLCRL